MEERHSTAEETVAGLNWKEAQLVPLRITHCRERHDSLVAHLTASDGSVTRDLILKQHRFHPSRPPVESARVEADILRKLHGHGDYAVPRLVLFDPHRAAVVMERVPGQSLEEIVVAARNRLAIARIEGAFRRTGRWLRWMQSETRADRDGAEMLAGLVASSLQDLDAVRDGLIVRNRPKIAAAIDRLKSSRAAMTVTGHHGDFWPGNVFIAGSAVSVIDFEGFRDGLPLEDVAYFLIHLELYFKYPMLGRQFRTAAAAFLAGYSGERPLDGATLRLLLIAEGLRFLARGAASADGPGTSLRAWLMRRTVGAAVLRSVRG